jgi:hypothetical protein
VEGETQVFEIVHTPGNWSLDTHTVAHADLVLWSNLVRPRSFLSQLAGSKKVVHFSHRSLLSTQGIHTQPVSYVGLELESDVGQVI